LEDKRVAINAQIARALGQGASNLSIITSAIFALISFFYIFTIGSFFKTSVYVLQNRVIYNTFFDIYVINRYTDHIIIASGMTLWLALSLKGKARFVIPIIYGGLTIITAIVNFEALLDMIVLISVPIILSLLIYSKITATTTAKLLILKISTDLSVNYLALIGIAISAAGLALSSAPIVSILTTSNSIRNFAYQIYVLFSSFSPFLIILLILCFPVKLWMRELMIRIGKMKNEKNEKNNDNNNSKKIQSSYYPPPSLIFSSISDSSSRLRPTVKAIWLFLFMILSIVIALIPHLLIINKDGQIVGTDAVRIAPVIRDLSMHSRNAQEFLWRAFVVELNGDRPLSLLFLVAIEKTVPAASDISHVIDYAPLILCPSLVLVVYFLTREITSNDIASLLAAFLTTISFQTLVGIFAGLYSNWFALIIGYLSFVFLFKFLKKPDNRINFVIYTMSFILLLFTHVYTWSMLAIVTGIFLIVILKLKYYQRRSIILLLLVVFSSVIIDIARMNITGSSGGIEKDIEISHSGIGLQQFALRWNNLIDTTLRFFNGLFGNSIILALGLYWLFKTNYLDPSSIFLMIFLSIGILPIFVGDETVQSRVFYNIPFQIPAAIGLTYIKKNVNGTLILLPICIWLLAISIRAVSNNYFVPPS
jgi:hypothetical protein